MSPLDTLHIGLDKLGVKVRQSRIARPEQQIGRGKSLGMLDLDLGPIRWLNVRQFDDGGSTFYEADLGVPDMRLGKIAQAAAISVHTERDGKTASWTGNDLGLGILESLNRDAALGRDFAYLGRPTPLGFGQKEASQNLKIGASTKHACWTITVPLKQDVSFALLFAGKKTHVPTTEELAWYQDVARMLLNGPLSTTWEN